ncbi:hypothetical protein GGTG_00758 [Gaeumannomyces tritici R3-111a-1]|uniref:DUF7587 domain-containing protein n=1 Tax=Gaeumannomyces tritici (strain R3-111a-1) TaxID=644352 RepID=J3NHM1_GAET3|nr:hypothetical protein GGTG_00758 [Gaeumannomyces tritici R3-111a-1]EJT80764.1 hypothetical protein GGTG_00758 [Gaeumannomyces tritici R3-111a-1]
MSNSFNTDAYWCTQPPPRLWRVVHCNTKAYEDNETGGLVARDSTRQFLSQQDLTEAVQSHLDWNPKQNSCFQSTFFNWDHARNWTRWQNDKDIMRCGQKNIEITLIDSSKLVQSTDIFIPQSFSELDLQREPKPDEVLVLHRMRLRLLGSTSKTDTRTPSYRENGLGSSRKTSVM